MNDPNVTPIDIEEQRSWLRDHKTATGQGWSLLARRIDIPSGTLSQFGSDKGYAGNEQKVAETIYRYRQTLTTQAALTVEAPEIPGYFETPTSAAILDLLAWAQRGRIVVGATAPGTGKTISARHYAACYQNVFLATMTPSTSGVNNMQQEVLAAMGEPNAVGTPQKLSQQIRAKVRDLKNPVIIIDEAQHLSEKAIEEIRSWHDAVNVGIALLGNVGVMQRLEGGNRKASFAQLYSRIGMRLLREKSLETDADALAEAWGIHGDAERAHIRRVVMMPGGLRGGTMMLEVASMIAVSEKQELALDHMQDAWTQLSQRAVIL